MQKFVSSTPYDGSRDPFTEYLLQHYSPIVVFLTEQLDVLYINGEAEKIFQLPTALGRFNIFKMLDREQALVFQNGVRNALMNEQPNIYRSISFVKDSQTKQADLYFKRVLLPEVAEPLVLIEISLDDDLPFEEKDPSIASPDAANKGERILALERQLRAAQRETQELVSELEATNEELQHSNRDLSVSNEEMRSTNEELQSVNEELYTVNSELQIKNEQLAIANDDINNLLRSIEIGTLFLDKDLTIRKFTMAIRNQFDLRTSDIGRSITNFSHKLHQLNIKLLSQTVFEKAEPLEQEIQDKRGNHYLMRMTPYRTGAEKVEGLVISFININDLVLSRERLRRSAYRFQAVFDNSDNVIMLLSKSGAVLTTNRDFGNYQSEALKGKSILKLLRKDDVALVADHIKALLRRRETRRQLVALEGKNGHDQWYELCMVPAIDEELEQEESVYIILLAQDVTESIKARRELKETLEEYRSFMDNARHQMILLDRNGTVRHINRTQHSKRTKEEIIGSSIYESVPPKFLEEYKAAIQSVFDGEGFKEIKFDYDFPDGSRRTVTLVATPVILNNDVKLVAVIRNEID